MIYLDNNATTQPLPEVVAAMTEALENDWGNPSSVHRMGQAARRRLELTRNSVAGLIGCADREIVFTSGGTESVNLAICGSLESQPGRNVLVTTRIEHSAVRDLAQHLSDHGTEVTWLECDHDGRVLVEPLQQMLVDRAGEIALVSVMWINNETGVVQPVEAIAELCRTHRVRFHTDATQRVGRLPVDIADAPIDLLTFSAHKFHGPKGVGVLYVRRGIRLTSQIVGGPQERERRAGTENIPGIVGLGAAAEQARAWLATDACLRQSALLERFEKAVLASVPDAVVNGGGAPRSWNTSNIAFPHLEAEAILLLLSERGVYASAGSACSSGSLDPSPVILAMHVEEALAHGSVRFSLSRLTTVEEIDEAARIVPVVIEKLRKSFAGT